MTTTPIAIEINCETGEVVERPLTAEEIAAQAAAAEQAAQEQAAREEEAKVAADAKASAISKLTALGLSDAEVAALIGA
jgi:Tfp pilus assembly ATPase PilU